MARHRLALCFRAGEPWSGGNPAHVRSVHPPQDRGVPARAANTDAQPSNRSSTTAMPSSSLEDVTSWATAFSSSWALAMATP